MPTYDGTILDTGGAVLNVKSSTFGAVGNGIADDTAAIQAAVNAAAAQRGTVLIPPGTYRVTSITLAAGITIQGYGATLVRPPNQGNWMRTLNAPEGAATIYSAHADSPLLTIRGLTLDGNSANQGAYRNHELQQAHLIFLSADPARSGRLRVSLEDLVLRNCVADGVSAYTNVDLQMVNCRADNCWRGGLVVTGGYTRGQVRNLMTTGAVDRTGIDVEPDGIGYGGSKAVELNVDGLTLDGNFDVTLNPGSILVASNVISRGAFEVSGQDSTVRISDSYFHVGQVSDRANRIVMPHDLTFQNCIFEVAGVSDQGPGVDAAAVNVYWNTAATSESGQRLRFVDCELRAAADLPSGLTLVGVLTQQDLLALDNRLIVEGGSISAAFQTGMVMSQGGRWIVKDTEIEADTAFQWTGTASGGERLADLRIERVAFSGTKYMYIVTHYSGNVVDHRDVVLEESQNVLSTAEGIGNNLYRGGRTIRVASSPIGRSVPGLVGDRARLAAPLAGQPYEWVCTASSTTAATWKQVASLAA